MKKFWLPAIIAAATLLPSAAFAQDAKGGLHEGFSLVMNIGPNYAFKEKLKTSGNQSIVVPAAGVEGSIDIGYKLPYFGFYFEFMLRSGSVLKTDKHYHCMLDTFNSDDICFSYNAVEKGDWDRYFMGIGPVLTGYIPLTDTMFLTASLGGLFYIGRTTDNDEAAKNFAIKASLGMGFAVTDTIALGFAINYEGFSDFRQSVQPAFSLIYNY